VIDRCDVPQLCVDDVSDHRVDNNKVAYGVRGLEEGTAKKVQERVVYLLRVDKATL
jgi:hypothetical protein